MTRAYAHLFALATVLGHRFEDRKDRSATAVEYGLIAAVIITAVSLLGGYLNDYFLDINTELTT